MRNQEVGTSKVDIWNAASRFLANRMKTRSQLEKHLQSKNYPTSDIDTVLSRFQDYGYVDDIEYASVYISHRIRKGYACRRIKRELSELGISADEIEAGMARYVDENGNDPMDDEYSRAKLEADKIIGSNGSPDNKKLAKAGRRLVSLGYPSETIYAILGEFMRGEGNEETT